MKIIHKKGPNGFETHEELIKNPNIRLEPMVEGFNYGWALQKMFGSYHGKSTIHYIPKEESLSFCGYYDVTNDLIANKIIFLTNDEKYSGLHKKCGNCLRNIPSYKKFGVMPFRGEK